MVIPPEGGYFIENGRRYGFYGAIGGAKENLPVELRHLSAARLVNGDENVTENITEVRGEKEKNDEWETVENSGILRNIDHIWEKHRDFWTYDELNEVFKNLDAKKRENELAGRDGIDRDESAIDTDEIERKAKELRIISDNDDVTSLPQGDGESASTSSSKLLSTADTNDQEMADAEKTVNRVQGGEKMRFATFVQALMKTAYWKMREHTRGSDVTDAGAGTSRDVSKGCIQESQRMQEGMDIGPAAYVQRRWNRADQNRMKNSAVLREI